jgi:TolB-like protein/DNA-binding winged helix-turn-helix (wHTH) protein/tetratricopeptide (TPR) repeat protein
VRFGRLAGAEPAGRPFSLRWTQGGPLGTIQGSIVRSVPPAPSDPSLPAPAVQRKPVEAPPERTLRFGPFELRVRTGELFQEGRPVRLRNQSTQILVLLAERAGQLLTREQIRSEVWGDGASVDFEQGLNHCIKEVRAALGDRAEAPTYVETLARRGYRFIAPVEREEPLPLAEPRAVAGPRRALLAAGGLGLVLIAVLAFLAWRARPVPVDPSRLMVAVLPFENLGGAEQEAFAAGLTEEIVGLLARLDPGRLGVIGRRPAMEYQQRPRGLEAMRRELGVSHVLSGAVRHEDGRVRITAGLTQLSDQRQVWSEAWERELTDVVAVQRSVAEAVGGRLFQALASTRTRSRVTQVDPEAHTLYLKGRHFWSRYDAAGIRKSVECFEQSIARQPDYAAAYVGLAEAYVALALRTSTPPAELAARARAAATRALALDAELPEARVAMAGVMGPMEWDWPGAERELRRALDLNPGDPTGHHWYSHVLRSQGRLEEALTQVRTAASLSPLSLVIGNDVGNALLHAGHAEEAGRQYRSLLELDHDFAPAHRGLGRVHLARGAHHEAVRSFTRAAALAEGPREQAWLAFGHARAGQRAEAQAVLARLDPTAPGSAYDLAAVHAALGNRAAALEGLERACREREPALALLLLDERFRALHAEPGFQAVARKVGISSQGSGVRSGG